MVSPDQCNYTLNNWPSAVAACAPSYDADRHSSADCVRGDVGQKLPVFPLAPDNDLTAVVEAASNAFELFKAHQLGLKST